MMYQRIKIGLVIPNPIGYSETFFKSKVDGLIDSGYDVTIFCRNDNRKNQDYIYCYEWPLSTFRLLRILQVLYGFIRLVLFSPYKTLRFFYFSLIERLSLKKILKNLYINGNIILSDNINVLHFGYLTMGLDREILGRVLNCKIFSSIRGYDIEIYPVKNPGCYNLLWKYLDKVHVISDDLLVSARKHGLPKTILIKKIRPAINIQNFISTNHFSFNHSKLKILSVGRLHWKKGHEYVFEALKKLKENGVKFKYTIVGQGDDWERLHYARKQLELENEIVFKGSISHNRIQEFYSCNDLFIQFSIQEGFCNSVIEAQASGMICIVSDASGLSENIVNNETGFVIKRRDKNELIRVIERVKNLPTKELEVISQNAIKRVKINFNLIDQKKYFKFFFKC